MLLLFHNFPVMWKIYVVNKTTNITEVRKLLIYVITTIYNLNLLNFFIS